MSNLYSGNIIKKIRIENNFTMEQICYGICDKATLVRIENGTTNPSLFILEALMERMGLEPSKYYFGVINKMESDFKNEISEIEWLISVYKFAEAESKIYALQSKTDKLGESTRNSSKKRLEQQLILRLKLSIMSKNNESRTSILSLIETGIKLTLNDFNEKEIPKYLLTKNEIYLLNLLSCTYFELNDKEKSIKIISDTKESIEKYTKDIFEKSQGYILTLFNMAKQLEDSNLFNEAIVLCNLAMSYCKKSNKLLYMPKLNFVKALCCYKMGYSNDKYIELMKVSYHTFMLFEDYKAAQDIKDFMINEEIGIWSN